MINDKERGHLRGLTKVSSMENSTTTSIMDKVLWFGLQKTQSTQGVGLKANKMASVHSFMTMGVPMQVIGLIIKETGKVRWPGRQETVFSPTMGSGKMIWSMVRANTLGPARISTMMESGQTTSETDMQWRPILMAENTKANSKITWDTDKGNFGSMTEATTKVGGKTI